MSLMEESSNRLHKRRNSGLNLPLPKAVLLLILSTILLTVSFSTNFLGVSSTEKFIKWQNDSEALIFGRLIKARQEGIKSGYGLLYKDSQWKDSNSYITGNFVDELIVYEAQIGLQGMIFSVMDRVLPIDRETKVQLFYMLNCFLTSILISILVAFLLVHFSIFTGVFALAACLFSPWLTFVAKNLYWVI